MGKELCSEALILDEFDKQWRQRWPGVAWPGSFTDVAMRCAQRRLTKDLRDEEIRACIAEMVIQGPDALLWSASEEP